MPTHFASMPNRLKQNFTRIRRTSGLNADSYGDATFTESQTASFKGFFQQGQLPGDKVLIQGHEVEYDAVVYSSGTFIVGENDVIVFGSSTSTSVAMRYHVKGINPVYDQTDVDHKEIYLSQEVR